MPIPIPFDIPRGVWLYRKGEGGLDEDLALTVFVPEDCDHRGLERAGEKGDFLSAPGRVFLRVESSGDLYDRLCIVGLAQGPKGRGKPLDTDLVIPFDETRLHRRSEFALDHRFQNSQRQWRMFATSVFAQAFGTKEMGRADRHGLSFWPLGSWEREAIGK